MAEFCVRRWRTEHNFHTYIEEFFLNYSKKTRKIKLSGYQVDNGTSLEHGNTKYLYRSVNKLLRIKKRAQAAKTGIGNTNKRGKHQSQTTGGDDGST